MKLYDIVADLFNYLIAFRLRIETGVKTSVDEVQKDLLRIFREQESKVRQNPGLILSYNRVRYALVVFADDVILNSRWEHGRDWAAHLIEWQLFESEIGGDRFFALCEELEANDQEVASIFYICLSMGFKGRYEPEAEELRLIQQGLWDKCNLAAADQDERISPEAYASGEGRSRRLPRILRWRHIAIAVIVLFALFAILDRFVIWRYITDPIGRVGDLSTMGPGMEEGPSPVRWPSAPSRFVPARAAQDQIPGHEAARSLSVSGREAHDGGGENQRAQW